jgi:hypothetical protein
MRVYNRAMSGSSWVSVEDYLPAGNALGYNENWRYRYSGGELLLMTCDVASRAGTIQVMQPVFIPSRCLQLVRA